MNRCSVTTSRRLVLALALCLPLAWGEACAQTVPARVLPIPALAPLGVLQVLGWPEALLNGQPARLAPGSRIRDTKNLIVPPASLVGQALNVQYILDPQGMIREAWILSAAELATQSPPSPALLSP